MASMASTATHMFTSLSISTQPMAAVKQTTEPTDKSMLPPVRIHSSMPAARTNTYAFWAIRLLMLPGRRFFPPVMIAKKITTTTSAMIIVYFWKKALTLILFSFIVSHPFPTEGSVP